MNYWGTVLGGAVLTFILTRAALFLLSKISIDKKYSIPIAAGSTFLLCLITYGGPPILAFLVYLPSVILWAIYDIYNISKNKNIDLRNDTKREADKNIKSTQKEPIGNITTNNTYTIRAKKMLNASLEGAENVVDMIFREAKLTQNTELRDMLKHFMTISGVSMAYMALDRIASEEERNKLADAINHEVKSYRGDALESIGECCYCINETRNPDLPKWQGPIISDLIDKLKKDHELNRAASVFTLAFGDWIWGKIVKDERFKDILSSMSRYEVLNLLLLTSMPITINMAAWWDNEKIILDNNQYRLPF